MCDDTRRRTIDRGDCISILERIASASGIDITDDEKYGDYYAMDDQELLAFIFDILDEIYPE